MVLLRRGRMAMMRMRMMLIELEWIRTTDWSTMCGGIGSMVVGKDTPRRFGRFM